MKVYENKNSGKSWAIQLKDENGVPTVSAVDRVTGEHIVDLIEFNPHGGIYSSPEAREIILVRGYDPNEHKNSWDEMGRIVIS